MFAYLALTIELFFVLQGISDPMLTFWFLLLFLFFTDFKKTFLVTLAVAFFLDLYSPIFGIYLIVYPCCIFVGHLLTKAVFTHRSLVSFTSVTLFLSSLAASLLYILFSVASLLFKDSAPSLPDLPSYILHHVFLLITQSVVLALCYYIGSRFFEKRFGYTIENMKAD